MKKILCLLLTLVLVFACVSCNKNGGDDTTNDDTNGGNQNTDNGGDNGNDDGDAGVDYVAKIFDTIKSSEPTQIVTKIDYTVGSKIYTSAYTTEKDSKSGVQRFTFNIVRYATVEELLPGNEKHINGVITKNADGSIISSEGDSWSESDAVGYLAEMLGIKNDYFNSVELSEDKCDLTATVTPENSKRVFGEDIAASGDITVEIDTNGTYLYEIVVKYTTPSGANMKIVTSYDYAVIEIANN